MFARQYVHVHIKNNEWIRKILWPTLLPPPFRKFSCVCCCNASPSSGGLGELQGTSVFVHFNITGGFTKSMFLTVQYGIKSRKASICSFNTGDDIVPIVIVETSAVLIDSLAKSRSSWWHANDVNCCFFFSFYIMYPSKTNSTFRMPKYVFVMGFLTVSHRFLCMCLFFIIIFHYQIVLSVLFPIFMLFETVEINSFSMLLVIVFSMVSLISTVKPSFFKSFVMSLIPLP